MTTAVRFLLLLGGWGHRRYADKNCMIRDIIILMMRVIPTTLRDASDRDAII
jgi:hypothetical protein